MRIARRPLSAVLLAPLAVGAMFLTTACTDSNQSDESGAASGATGSTAASGDQDGSSATDVTDGVSAMPTAGGPDKAIIDADMGQLNDDAVAMFMLTQNADKVELLGVTTVAGNTWAEEGTAYSLRQLQLVGREDVPVYQGAGVPLMGDRLNTIDAEQALWGNSEYIGSLSRERPASYKELAEEPYGGYPEAAPAEGSAVEFIADSVRENPGDVTIFALGPATNIAMFVTEYPDLVPQVKQIIYMGGAIDIPGNTTPAAEFNWWYDPEAIRIALHAPFQKQIVVPNDVAESVYYTKAEYDRIIAGADTPITQMFKDRQAERFEKDPNAQSFVWDAMTAAIFLDPSIATDVQERHIDIDTQLGPDYGRALGYHDSRHRDNATGEGFPANTQKVDIVFDIDHEKFFDLYTELMGAPLS